MNLMKMVVKASIRLALHLVHGNSIGRYATTLILNDSFKRTTIVDHQNIKLQFCTPNDISKWRATSFSTKEPETLEWIDSIPRESVFWDIGANVGIYSVYAAKKQSCRVFSFEPSVFNLELLARNIFLNNLTEFITIVPLPLTDKLAISNLNLTSTAWGGAMSTFDQSYGHDGNTMEKVFVIPTLGISMSDAITLLKIPEPDYIKMDVDGIEHLILKGGMLVLEKTKGVLIEINDEFKVQAEEARNYLVEAGFTLKEKRHADYFNTVTSAAAHTYNQIWVK